MYKFILSAQLSVNQVDIVISFQIMVACASPFGTVSEDFRGKIYIVGPGDKKEYDEPRNLIFFIFTIGPARYSI